MISVERCTQADVADAMLFIDEHWRKDHVLARRRDLFDWQHGCPDGSYNFLLAKSDTRILGILGYIPASRYDGAMQTDDVVWLALWKIRSDAGHAGLGLSLLRELGRLYPNASLGVNGIHSSLLPMYRSLGFMASELRQFYLLNPVAPQKLVRGNHDRIVAAEPGRATFARLDREYLSRLKLPGRLGSTVPAKTPQYFRWRYLDHPYYHYRVFSIALDGFPRAIVATRVDHHEGAKALRIVDFAGDAGILAECGAGFSALLVEAEAEYADFWNYGLDDQPLEAAGFVVSAEDGPDVPTYFEPFTKGRTRIFFAMKVPDNRSPLVFKADGDQDRPNQLSW